MYYITITPYSKEKPHKQKVDEDLVLSCLEKLNLLSPHKLQVRSQFCTGGDHHRSIDIVEELVYDCTKHGFVVEHDTIQAVSQALSLQYRTEGTH